MIILTKGVNKRQLRYASLIPIGSDNYTNCPQKELARPMTYVEPAKYWAFLSYSHRDAKWATWLHKALESYRPPKQLIGTVTARGPVPKRLAPIFRDREELASATDLGTVINEALRRSACQIVICSRSAARSKWVNEEILAFKRLGREDRIFCLIVGGEPNASDDPAHADEECFPSALRYRLGADGELSSVRTEPIAADARPGKDGRNNAKLKLIAGLLGVGFDGLRQREQRRRQRQLFAIASGAVAGMVLTTGLAAAALIARATAQRQTVIAKREAETARQTTVFLVDLFRISDPARRAVTASPRVRCSTRALRGSTRSWRSSRRSRRRSWTHSERCTWVSGSTGRRSRCSSRRSPSGRCSCPRNRRSSRAP
jgi:hypothetical protein